MSFCLIWLVHCYYTLSSYYIDLPFMAHSSSSYCIDIPFMVYSTDSSANCAVKCFNFRSDDLSTLLPRLKHVNHTVMCKLFLPSFIYLFTIHAWLVSSRKFVIWVCAYMRNTYQQDGVGLGPLHKLVGLEFNNWIDFTNTKDWRNIYTTVVGRRWWWVPKLFLLSTVMTFVTTTTDETV